MNETEELLGQWESDPAAFASSFTISDKNAIVVDFDLTRPQILVLDALERHKKVMALKGRQMFVTTIGIVWQLRLCWLMPGSICAVVLHTDANAVLMSDFAEKLYRGNPLLGLEMPVAQKNAHRILFSNGSQLLFTTANSGFLRSYPVNFAHLSEARDYDDLGATLASLKLAPDGQMLLESTAGGDDDFHSIWVDSNADFFKLFLCWREHPEYRSDREFPVPLLREERDYINKHALSLREAQWWVRERRGLAPHKRILMTQEHPSDPEEAFLLSGDKFLRRQVPFPAADPQQPDETGLVVLLPYDPLHQYAIGIDPAPGSSEYGDPTAVVILDITAWAVAATQEFRTPTREHERRTRQLIKSYGDPVTAIETVQEGLGLCDYMRNEGVPMFHMVAFAGVSQETLPRHGWRTDFQTRPILWGGMYEGAIGQKPWTIGCHRLVAQLNALCYDKRGKPAAPKTGHDDLAVAFGIAIQACAQAMPPAQVKKEPEESEMSAWERQMLTGAGAVDFFDDAYPSESNDFY